MPSTTAAPTSGLANDNDRRRVFAPRFRTALCRTFQKTGACPLSAKCMFAHSEAELRTVQQNLDDQLLCESAIRAWKKTHQSGGGGTAVLPPSAPTAAVLQGLKDEAAVTTARLPSSSSSSASSLEGGGYRRYRHNPYDLARVIVPCSS